MPTRASRVRLMPLILTPPYREGVTDVTPRLRTLHVTGLLLLLLTGPAYTPYAAAYEPVPAESRAGSRAGEGRERPGREATPTDENSTPAHSDGPASRQSPDTNPPSPEDSESTGSTDSPGSPENEEGLESQEGQGGRDQELRDRERQEQEASVLPETSRNTAPPSEPPPARPADAHKAADRPVRASEPVLRVLPLGSGLVLIGLGLGLAFLALRVRRN